MSFSPAQAEQEAFGGEDGARSDEARGGSDYVAKEVDHRAILGPVVLQVQPRRAARPAYGVSAAHTRRARVADQIILSP